MLKVIPKAWSYEFSVTDGADAVAQAVSLSWWDDKGELRVQGVTYTARRVKSSYVLESADGELARAEWPPEWTRKLAGELVIAHAGRRYALRAKSVFRRAFLVFEGSRQIGFILPEGHFTRKAMVELPKELPLFLQVFIMWLAMTLWKRLDANMAY